MAIQKLMDEDGELVDFLDKELTKKFRRIETATHYIEKLDEQITEKNDKVNNCFEDLRFKAGDEIAEKFIRSSTRGKKIANKLNRKAYLDALRSSMDILKKEIFGYKELTENQIARDTTEVADES